MTSSKPLIVTAGEPAGVGPELCLALPRAAPSIPFVVIGDAAMLRERAASLGIEVTIQAVSLDAPPAEPADPSILQVVNVPCAELPRPGQPLAINAESLLVGLHLAVQACLDGKFAGLVTAPLQKSTINNAGFVFTGHTEFLAEQCGAAQAVMLLVAGDLRVALATTHLPLREVPDALTRERLHRVLTTLAEGLQVRFGISDPEIVVCGLNPHAGEGGHLGREEEDVITPVVRELSQRGLKLRGPVPADTAFTPATGHKDAVLAMYHDQGLPVLKHAGFGHAVNVSLGLPIVRTSVDHGTALDIAGQGKADTGSLLAALELAAKLAAR